MFEVPDFDLKKKHSWLIIYYFWQASLFSNSEMAEVFQSYADNIGAEYRFHQECHGLIANLLLFRTTESMILKVDWYIKDESMRFNVTFGIAT